MTIILPSKKNKTASLSYHKKFKTNNNIIKANYLETNKAQEHECVSIPNILQYFEGY